MKYMSRVSAGMPNTFVCIVCHKVKSNVVWCHVVHLA